MTRCSACGISKPLSAFGKRWDKERQSFYRRGRCKECRGRDEKRRYDTRSPSQRLKAKDRSLTRLYGISLAEYNAMFTQQEGACAACRVPQSRTSKALAVDHCHKTGIVRGLLCRGCNVALGNAKEDPRVLEAIAEYIRRFQ